jgi:hypothetical protein
MPSITINDEARRAIANAATPPFRDTALPVGPDAFNIQLDQTTCDRLAERRFPQESWSDLIIRLTALHQSGGRHH